MDDTILVEKYKKADSAGYRWIEISKKG